MNGSEGIVLNTCNYTPIYIIQDTGVTLAKSYVLPQTPQVQKPVADNLKTFYEYSGNLENLLTCEPNVPKPSVTKNIENVQLGNNLKLASFIEPKSNIVNKAQVLMKNVPIKPTLTINSGTITPTAPKVIGRRKIIKCKRSVSTISPRLITNIKPKTSVTIPSQVSSVQLLKPGGKYSLQDLNGKPVKVVNLGIKNIKRIESTTQEPTYDPDTKTHITYKVISPDDLAVVGKNKVVIKEKKSENKKNCRKEEHKLLEHADEEDIEPKPEPEISTEPVMTRSGRKVNRPKQIDPGRSTCAKPKRKNGPVVCTHCLSEFGSLYRLQRHYEMHPKHVSTDLHSDLFHCLLGIIASGSHDDKANIFIQQLEQLIDKIKSLLPCLLKKIDGNDGKLCTVNDDLGRLFGMNPGKYNLNMEAINCVKDNSGHCRHNPPKNNSFDSDLSKTSQFWLSNHNEPRADAEVEIDDCARINSIDKWPTVSKRIWKMKDQKLNSKKLKLNSENNDTQIDLCIEDSVLNNNNETHNGGVSTINLTKTDSLVDRNVDKNYEVLNDNSNFDIDEDCVNKKNSHTQFYSAHFDIRSSPIKPSSATFHKFQINPQKISESDVRLRPLILDSKTEEPKDVEIEMNDLQGIFKDIVMPCKHNEVNSELTFGDAKSWGTSASNNKDNDSFMKSDSLIEPPYLNVEDICIDKSLDNNMDVTEHLQCSDSRLSNQGVFNFLESLGNECLSHSESDIGNNSVDFNLDLFSFHTS